MPLSYLVRLESKNQDKISFESGLELYQDTWMNNEEKVTLKGIVVHGIGKAEKMGIVKGDLIYFRYDVVSDGSLSDEGYRVHDNKVTVNGETLWIVQPERVIAVEQFWGPQAVGDYVVGVQHKIKKWESSLILQSDLSSEVEENVIEVKYPCNDFAVGEKLMVMKDYLHHYNFNSRVGEDVVVVKKDYIIGKVDTP